MKYLTPLMLLGLLLLSACARHINTLIDKSGNVKSTEVSSSIIKTDSHYDINYPEQQGRSLKIKYLGCGGFYIERGEESLLIDPYFTNISFLSVFAKHRTNTDWVKMGMKGISGQKASSIWVSHTHYDHMMDVAHVYENYTGPNAQVYSSKAGTLKLKNLKPAIRMVNIDSAINVADATGNHYQQLVGNNRIKVTPVKTEHAPHWWKIRMFSGKMKEDTDYAKSSDKTRASSWKLGEDYSYFIDLLDKEKNIEFRIYIQSSTSQWLEGWLPDIIKAGPKVDLAILGAASHTYTGWGEGKSNYPMKLVQDSNIQPEHVLICHWEDFFGDYPQNLGKDAKKVRATNVKKFIKKLDSVYLWKVDDFERISMPLPGTWVDVRY